MTIVYRFDRCDADNLMVILHFTRRARLVSEAAVPFFIPTTKVQGFPFLPPNPQQHLIICVLITGFLVGVN